MRFVGVFTLVFCAMIMMSCKDDEGEVQLPNDQDTPQSDAQGADTIEWVSSLDFEIALSRSDDDAIVYLTRGYQDYKPTYSPDGSKIAFFRIVQQNGAEPEDWKTKICVINTDGTGFKELTDGEHTDWNPMWSRDGSDQVIFTRFFTRVPYTTQVYAVDQDGESSAELISDDQYSEFAYSGLRDGRILVRRSENNTSFSYLLMSPGSTEVNYDLLDYPNQFLHKMSISPSEEKITYMKMKDFGDIYAESVITYADLNLQTMSFDNETEITSHDSSDVTWYPCWTSSEDYIVYCYMSDDTSWRGRIMAYDMTRGITSVISRHGNKSHWYPNVKEVVK